MLNASLSLFASLIPETISLTIFVALSNAACEMGACCDFAMQAVARSNSIRYLGGLCIGVIINGCKQKAPWPSVYSH